MDIKIPDSTLRKFLNTQASAEKIAEALTLCGPSVDRLEQIGDDYVYDIEAITNRVDTASAFGVAREANAILPLFGFKAKLVNSPYEVKSSELPQRKSKKLPLIVEIKNSDLVTRLCAIVLDQLVVGPSPKDISNQLERAGIRSINNLVDVTNYLTLCYGQPVHIFDYDKIQGHKLILRNSQKNETIITLDEKKHLLRGEDIVIENEAGQLIDLCGIMGGKLSQVDENTKRAVLFVQTYNPKKIRQTSLYTQERTLAAQIFEKNPDQRLVVPVLIEGVKLLTQIANAQIAGDSIDLNFQTAKPKTISLNLKWLNNHIGHNFEINDVSSILTNLGFKMSNQKNDSLEAQVPTWRAHDISISEDLAEEVARIYGYFRLKSQLPNTANSSIDIDPLLGWEFNTKNFLSNLGFTEIFNYSLVSRDIFTKAQMSIDHSISLKNPLTTEFEFMRRSLIPSLLMDLEQNQGKVDLPIRLFELSNIYISNNSSDLPDELPILAMATQGITFRQSKGYLEALFVNLKLENINFTNLDDNSDSPWQKNQTAQIYSGTHFVGIFGTINNSVKNSFSLKDEVCIANLDFKTISHLSSSLPKITPVPAFPDVIEDVTIKSNIPVGKLISNIFKSSKLISKVFYRLSYQNKHTFTIHFNHPKRNLTQTEVDSIKEKLSKES